MSGSGGHGAGNAAPWLILSVMGGGAAVEAVVWLGGSLGALASGAGWNPPSFSVATLFTLVRSGPEALWPGVGAGWLWSGIAVVAAVLVAIAVAVARWVWMRSSGIAGLARRRELEALTVKGLTRRVKGLRPSLAHEAEIDPDQVGMLLGELEPDGLELRASWEDVILAFMAPRSGKTTALAVPMALRAPGAVLLTSIKPDVYAVTRAARARRGTVWVFDMQGIAHTQQGMWWDMLAQARTLEGARRLAGHFITASVDAASRRDFWFSAAGNTLTALFYAAACTGRTVNDVLVWLAQPADRTPVDLLNDIGMTALAHQLEGTINGAPDTRDGIYETARQCVACLLDPQIAAWVTPQPHLEQFVPDQFVDSRDTLYLLSENSGGSATGVIAACTDAVLRAGTARASQQGGRIDPPLVAVLDEAANICRIEDLPDLYSHLGSRGLVVLTILQSFRQGAKVWGEIGMDALWSAATIKVLGAGLDDADFTEKVSRLIGDHKVPELTVSHGSGGRSTSITRRMERIMQAADIRALPKSTALLLATGVRPALIRLRPWYAEPDADELSRAEAAETKAITVRARSTSTESERRL
ncbi:type IV secretory system conjugative DNA transfer family protein [Actinomadura kijaniata]|uniref:type IV secretory system conjugative DNA transfer family protein n=1 Tax=Actinomadura kijaniata TaxID=46161 RepID=UPI00082C94D2|nr:type IV secretory system conjugative DNA transfer family protein [Actinomadura kijaniata]